MALFKYGLKCSVCGKLESAFTTATLAKKAVDSHQAAYAVLGETDHKVIIIDLEGEKRGS